MIDVGTMERMLIEITTGKQPARADTPEEAKVRAKLKAECDDIKARGGVVEIPHEIPDVD
jgi:hypothetical protein